MLIDNFKELVILSVTDGHNVYSVVLTTHLYIIDCHFKHIEPILKLFIFLYQEFHNDSKNISFNIYFCQYLIVNKHFHSDSCLKLPIICTFASAGHICTRGENSTLYLHLQGAQVYIFTL